MVVFQDRGLFGRWEKGESTRCLNSFSFINSRGVDKDAYYVLEFGDLFSWARLLRDGPKRSRVNNPLYEGWTCCPAWLWFGHCDTVSYVRFKDRFIFVSRYSGFENGLFVTSQMLCPEVARNISRAICFAASVQSRGSRLPTLVQLGCLQRLCLQLRPAFLQPFILHPLRSDRPKTPISIEDIVLKMAEVKVDDPDVPKSNKAFVPLGKAPVPTAVRVHS